MDQSEIIYLVVRFWFWRGNQSLKFQDENLFQIRFTPVRTRFGLGLILEHSQNFVILQCSCSVTLGKLPSDDFLSHLKDPRVGIRLKRWLTVRKALSFYRHCHWVRILYYRNNHRIRLCFDNIRFHHRYRSLFSS